MLQWIGCGLLVVAGGGLGFYYSSQWTSRLSALKGLYQAMNLLKGEISYGSLTLPDAFLRMGKRLRPPVSFFFTSLGRRLKGRPGEPFSVIFEAAMKKELAGSGLSKGDLEQLRELGNQLGYLDSQTQLRTLDLYTHSLEDTIRVLREELPGRTRVYKSLGILGGLCLAILFL